MSKITSGDIFTHNGNRFHLTIKADDTAQPPWVHNDGHGPVSDWTRRNKAPGELVLASDRHGYKLYYDFAKAIAIAKRDGWNCDPLDTVETKGQRAERAVKSDFEYLRRWCADEWQYVGLIVQFVDDDDDIIEEPLASVWGVESDSDDYITTLAHELAAELQHGMLSLKSA